MLLLAKVIEASPVLAVAVPVAEAETVEFVPSTPVTVPIVVPVDVYPATGVGGFGKNVQTTERPFCPDAVKPTTLVPPLIE
tara:strand:- start:167 stop:409 length:243 start_codon:yes stop_codon:yes gene_type:complete